jgi:tryptophanyl-tRNA synthetase
LNNYISLRDSDDVIASKVRSMTDISQDTQTSPVEELLAVFQSDDEQAATSNSKETLIELISAELQPMRERVKELAEHPEDVRRIIDHGSEEAREIAEETLEEVRAAMGINYK